MIILPYRTMKKEAPYVPPAVPTRLHKQRCPRKGGIFAASSRREGLTVEHLAAHIVYAHVLPDYETKGAA